MNRYAYSIPVLLILTLVFSLRITTGKTAPDFCRQYSRLTKVLDQNHIHPPELNNQFSERIHTLFLNKLDPQNLYFTEGEKAMMPAKDRWDDLIRSDSCFRLSGITDLHARSLNKADSLIEALLDTPFDYTREEYIEFVFNQKNQDEKKGPAEPESYRKKWRKWLKYLVLKEMRELVPDTIDAPSKKILKQKEEEARGNVRYRQSCKLNRMLNHTGGHQKYVQSLFLKAMAESYDPHTSYLSQTEYKTIKQSISRSSQSFGVRFSEPHAGKIKVERVVPGGPAWESKKLHQGDLLTRVKPEGKEAFDLRCIDLRTLNSKLAGIQDDRQVRFTVKKSGGEKISVVLQKGKMREKGNSINSFILKGEEDVGYMSIPSFYTQWDTTKVEGCANDVAKEILKLKRDSIEGLILDFRYNQGGSLKEAVELAGNFIDIGPVGMMKRRGKESFIMKDRNRGTVYDGPVTVMVNSSSASASEVVAAALKDHNRALVVGSNTFGKATGQVVRGLRKGNVALKERNDKPNSAYAKLTVQTLYRITGETHQYNGLKPHVSFPDLGDIYISSESEMYYALNPEALAGKASYQPLDPLPVSELKQKSMERLDEHPVFTRVERLKDSLEALDGEMKKSLHISDWTGSSGNPLVPSYDQESTFSEEELYEVDNHRFDTSILLLNKFRARMNKQRKREIQNDIRIRETYRIMQDYLDILND